MRRVFLAIGMSGLLLYSCGQGQQEQEHGRPVRPESEYGAPAAGESGAEPVGEDTTVIHHEQGQDTLYDDPSFSKRGTEENPGMQEGGQEGRSGQQGQTQQGQDGQMDAGNQGRQQGQRSQEEQSSHYNDGVETEQVFGRDTAMGEEYNDDQVSRRHGYGRTDATGPDKDEVERDRQRPAGRGTEEGTYPPQDRYGATGAGEDENTGYDAGTQ